MHSMTTKPDGAQALGRIRHMIVSGNTIAGRLPWSVPALLALLIPAWVFRSSACAKADGFAIADSTWWLFENEYALPLIPAAAAVLATLAEHVFSVALALGIATRASAAALLGVTAVIQIFVYPSACATHGL